MSRYLQQLRLLAANWTNFDAATRKEMKVAPFVLASQHVSTTKPTTKKWLGGKGADAGTDEYEIEWVLCRAEEVRQRPQSHVFLPTDHCRSH